MVKVVDIAQIISKNLLARLLLISLVIIVFIILLIFYSPIHLFPNQTILGSTSKQIDDSLSRLEVREDIQLEIEEQVASGEQEKVVYSSGDLSIVLIEGDWMQGGGCRVKTDVYLYKLKDKHYVIDIDNTYKLRSPEDIQGYLDVVRIYDYYRFKFCGYGYYFLTSKPYYFYPLDLSKSCKPKLQDVRARLEKENGKDVLIYYYYSDVAEPVGLVEYRLSFVDGRAEEERIPIYQCPGIIY